jgi:predicted regulator of Ras-like GTPase activity (Roadblock/LC7/MglB family)
MNYGIETQEQLESIENTLQKELIDIGVICTILLDTAGNTIAKADDGKKSYDTYAFAALAAGNYASVDAMAQLIDEKEFSMLFHKGEHNSIQFCKVNEDLLLVNIFGKEISLGFLRLKVTEVVEKIKKICRATQKASAS